VRFLLRPTGLEEIGPRTSRTALGRRESDGPGVNPIESSRPPFLTVTNGSNRASNYAWDIGEPNQVRKPERSLAGLEEQPKIGT
jgi:hypothetical protein